MSLEECLDIPDFDISVIWEIFVRCRSFDKVIGSSVLSILLDFIQF